MSFSPKRRQLAEAVTTTSLGKPAEVVEEYKYLGTIFDNQLKFSSSTEDILKKCHQRQYLLWKLNSFDVSKDILTDFYYSFIERLVSFTPLVFKIETAYIKQLKSAPELLDTL